MGISKNIFQTIDKHDRNLVQIFSVADTAIGITIRIIPSCIETKCMFNCLSTTVSNTVNNCHFTFESGNNLCILMGLQEKLWEKSVGLYIQA